MTRNREEAINLSIENTQIIEGKYKLDDYKNKHIIKRDYEIEKFLENHKKNIFNYKNLPVEKLSAYVDAGIIKPSDIEETKAKAISKLHYALANEDDLIFQAEKIINELNSRNSGADAIKKLNDAILRKKYTPPSPKDIKELWKDDRRKDDNVISFIQRVYEPWLGKGLIQADIRPIDRPLYNAFLQWKFREKPIPKGFILPKKSDEEVSLPSQNVLNAEKEAKAIKARLAYRKKKKSTS